MIQKNTKLIGKLEVNAKPSDFIVSGIIGSSILNGSLNYQKHKKGIITQNEAVKNTLKGASQSAIATGSAIACVQYLSNKNILKALLSAAVGVGGVLAIETICEKKEEHAK